MLLSVPLDDGPKTAGKLEIRIVHSSCPGYVQGEVARVGQLRSPGYNKGAGTRAITSLETSLEFKDRRAKFEAGK